MGNPDTGRGAVANPGNPDTRERLRTAGPFILDGLLAVVMAAVGFALLASALPGPVAVEVVDDGRGGDPGRDHGGHGIAGMREPAALYGGALEAGPGPGGGFRVLVSLPVGAP